MLKEIKNIGKYSTRPGFTLVELIIVAAMTSLICVTIIGMVSSGYKDWKLGSGRSTVLQDGFAAMSQMSRPLRQSKGFVSVSNPADEAGYITFAVGANDNFMRFQLNAATRELEYGQLGALTPLVGPVTRLVFKSYDAGGDMIVDLTEIDRIRSVVIEATFVDDEDPSIAFSLSDRISCGKDFQYVVINEIMYNPPVDEDEPLEWVELHNFGKRLFDLTGWKIWTKDSSKTDLLIPHPTFGNGSMTIPAGGYAIITTDDTQVTGVDPDALWLSSGDENIGNGLTNKSGKGKGKGKKKDNEARTIVTITDGTNQIDSVTYSNTWGAYGDGKTLARIDPYYGNSDDPTNWNSQTMGGTPGSQN